MLILSVFNSNTLTQNLTEYKGEIYHLFTHCLIAYPDIAFDKNNNMRSAYLTDCITVDEFNKILKSLYENDYILIDINSIYKIDKNGKAIKNTLLLPKGKKPLILSFDDVNYDRKKMGKGMVDKIILDKYGQLATSTLINGKEEISYNNEFITCLENFINKHKSFSFKNARGTINLTGYDGILGYRTNTNSTNREKEIKKCKKVIKKLKDNGWTFASHSYGHYHMKKISVEKFKEEVYSWKNEVEPLVGQTNIYVYPYGEWEVYKDKQLSLKHKILQDAGFKLFCGVGVQSFYSYLPHPENVEAVLFMDRTPLDGYTITNKKEKLCHLFNADDIIDNKRFI